MTSAWWTMRSIITRGDDLVSGRPGPELKAGWTSGSGRRVRSGRRRAGRTGSPRPARREVADLVDDDEAVSAQPDQFGGESTARWASLRRATQSVAVANRTRWLAGQLGDAESAWLSASCQCRAGQKQDHVAVSLPVRWPRRECVDRGPGGGLVSEVEVLDGLDRGHPCGRIRSWAPGAGGDLAFEHGGQVLLVGPAGVAGVVGQAGRGFREGCFPF